MFGHYHGITPKKYINKHRITVAKKIMGATEDINLITIAIHLGYSNQSVFTNAFKQFEETPPQPVERLKKN